MTDGLTIDREDIVDLVLAVKSLFCFVRDKHNIPKGEDFNCPYFRRVNHIMKKIDDKNLGIFDNEVLRRLSILRGKSQPTDDDNRYIQDVLIPIARDGLWLGDKAEEEFKRDRAEMKRLEKKLFGVEE